MSAVINLYEQKNKLVKQLTDLRESAGTVKMANGQEAPGFTADQLRQWKEIGSDLEGVVAELKAYELAGQLIDSDREAKNRPDVDWEERESSQPGFASAVKKFGNNGLYKGIEEVVKCDPSKSFGVKATMTTAAGFAPSQRRDGEITMMAQYAPLLLDRLNVIPWDRDVYRWMAQTTRTNASAAKAQAAALDESTIVFTERTATLQKHGTYLPITEEQLRYAPEIRSIINEDLIRMVRQNFGKEVIVGPGTGDRILGILNQVGAQTQAKGGAESPFDAIMKAATKSRVSEGGGGGANPNVIVLHPNDYQDLRLTKDGEGRYLMGDPGTPGAQTIWGLEIVIDEGLTENTGLVFDTNLIRVPVAEDVVIAISDSHTDYFVKNILAARAHMFGCVASRRDAAIVKVTGI